MQKQTPQCERRGFSVSLILIHVEISQSLLICCNHCISLHLLTDPHWGQRASPFSFAGPKRHQAPGIPFDQLPRIDAVVISHNHWDHLDQETVQTLMDRHSGIRFFVPLGIQYWFKKEIKGAVLQGPARNVIALDWDQHVSIKGQTKNLELHFLAVQHWSARSLGDSFCSYPIAQGLGIGRKLLTHAEVLAKQSGHSSRSLTL